MKLAKFLNTRVLVLVLSLSVINVHGLTIGLGSHPIEAKADKSVDKQDQDSEEQDSEDIEKKLKKMGLKHTEQVFQSKASWYGNAFHGRRTASSEIFDSNVLSAAHKTLAMGTYLLVTNIGNGKQVVVRVNDRGPYIQGRDIDISEAAAKIIGSHSQGVANVSFEILADKDEKIQEKISETQSQISLNDEVQI